MLQFGAIYLHAFIYLFISSGVFARQSCSLKQGIIRVLWQKHSEELLLSICFSVVPMQQQGAASHADSLMPIRAVTCFLVENKTKVYDIIGKKTISTIKLGLPVLFLVFTDPFIYSSYSNLLVDRATDQSLS